MSVQTYAVSHLGNPEILRTPYEQHATLVARPDALLKFEQAQERNVAPGNDIKREDGYPHANHQRMNRKRSGGLKKFLFCVGADENTDRWNEDNEADRDEDDMKARERVPWNAELECYLLSCIDQLETNGINGERLFAVSGDMEVINNMRGKYSEPIPDGTDRHIICAVLKHAVRDAESPLVDKEALREWSLSIAAKKTQQSETGTSTEGLLNEIPTYSDSHLYHTLQLIRDISPRRAYVLGRLLILLGDISARMEVTQMTSHNLARCLAPSILQWDPCEDGSLLVLGRMTAYVLDLIDDARVHAERLKSYVRELEHLAALPSTPSQLQLERQTELLMV